MQPEWQFVPDGFRYNIRIIGSLPYGYKLSYSYEALASKSLFMTREDIADRGPKRFKKEYWGHYVVTPVKQVEIYVKFPEGYRVKRFHVGACIGGTPSDELMNTQEIQRIQKEGRFEPSEYSAKLKFESPYVGFSYFIYWEPPTQKEIDALKLVDGPSTRGEGGDIHV